MGDWHQAAAMAIFVLAYVLFVVFPAKRTLVALSGSALLVAAGILTPQETFLAINWNVMGIFVGTLAVADIFMESRVPAYMAERIVNRVPSTAWAMLALCGLTGFISAFVENVATVLIVAPIAFAMASKLKINPSQLMISIAVSSNLQGAATLIGDPPSMLLGGFAKMTFWDFFIYQGKPGIFFAVEIGALASAFVLYWFFRQHREKPVVVPTEKVRSWFPTVLLVGMVVALAVSSFLDKGFSYLAGIICMICGFVALAWDRGSNQRSIRQGVQKMDWDTSFFLIGVFVLVGSIAETGWIEVIAASLAQVVGTNLLAAYALLVFLAVLLSAFIDNVPFLAAMLPVALSLAEKLGVPAPVLLFGLLIGASLGGNITPIGASANIVACGLLKKHGHPVTFPQFMRIGVPFTLVAVAAAGAFVWGIWGAR